MVATNGIAIRSALIALLACSSGDSAPTSTVSFGIHADGTAYCDGPDTQTAPQRYPLPDTTHYLFTCSWTCGVYDEKAKHVSVTFVCADPPGGCAIVAPDVSACP